MYFAERDLKFFQTIRDNNLIINAEDFDKQFNLLTSHVNNINKLSNVLIDKGLSISTNNQNLSFNAIVNIGDGKLLARKVTNNDILGIIKLNKLMSNFYTVLCSFDNKTRIVKNDGNRNGFICSYNREPLLKLLTSDNFNIINGNKFKLNSIELNKLSFIVPKARIVKINTISNNMIMNGSIDFDLFPNNEITYLKISLAQRQARERNIASIINGTYRKKISYVGNFDNRHFADKVITRFTKVGNNEYYTNFSKIFTKKNIPEKIIDKDIISPPFSIRNVFMLNSITTNYFKKPLILVGDYSAYYKINDNYIHIKNNIQSKIGIKKLHPDLRNFLLQ